MTLLEGFQTSGLAGSDEKYSAIPSASRYCPIYKINIDNNMKLLQKYRDSNSPVSAENTQSIIDDFKKKYDEMNCEAYMNSLNNISVPQASVAPSTAATGSS